MGVRKQVALSNQDSMLKGIPTITYWRVDINQFLAVLRFEFRHQPEDKTIPHSLIKGHIKQHQTVSGKPSVGAKPEGLMMASENNTFGLAQRTPSHKEKGYIDTLRYHQLGKEEQVRVANVASLAAAAGASKRENKVKPSQPTSSDREQTKDTQISPLPAAQASGEAASPKQTAEKPAIAQKPVIPSFPKRNKPTCPPKPAILRHTGSQPVNIGSGRQSTRSSGGSVGSGKGDCSARASSLSPTSLSPFVNKPDYAPPPPPSFANRSGSLKGKESEDTTTTADGVELRKRSLSARHELAADGPVLVEQLHRQTMVDDKSAESSPQAQHRVNHPLSHLLSVSDDNSSDSSNEDSETNDDGQADDLYVNIAIARDSSEKERPESVTSEEAGQSEVSVLWK